MRLVKNFLEAIRAIIPLLLAAAILAAGLTYWIQRDAMLESRIRDVLLQEGLITQDDLLGEKIKDVLIEEGVIVEPE